MRYISFAAGVCLFMAINPAAAQVQCLIPNNDQNGTLTFENVCEDPVVVQFEIGNPDFRDHRCYAAQADQYPCEAVVRAGGKTRLDIPSGDLLGQYRACYEDEVGTAICEFE